MLEVEPEDDGVEVLSVEMLYDVVADVELLYLLQVGDGLCLAVHNDRHAV